MMMMTTIEIASTMATASMIAAQTASTIAIVSTE
jgi:hypothetical protein